MSGTGILTSMGNHALFIRKGSVKDVLDLPLTLTDGAAINAGMAASISSGGKAVAGLTDPAVPAFFANSGTDANNYPDVQRDRGMPPTTFSLISCLSAIEVTTTEFNSAVSYPFGTALTAVAAGNANAGIIRPVAAATDVVIGYVSMAGKGVGPDGYATLSFYAAFKPGTTIPTDLT